MTKGDDTPAREAKQNPKEAHVSALAAELSEWRHERDQLSSTELEAELHEVDRSYEDARAALEEAEKTPAKLWVQTKAKVDDAFQVFRSAIHRIKLPR